MFLDHSQNSLNLSKLAGQLHAVHVPHSQCTSSSGSSIHLMDGFHMPPIASNFIFSGAVSGIAQTIAPTALKQPVREEASVLSAPAVSTGMFAPRSIAAPNSTAQLTIFYAGSVNTFDNVSRGMADQIMFLAANATQAVHSCPPEEQLELLRMPFSVAMMPRGCCLELAVPQARRASLARFLKRRRERLANALRLSNDEKSPGKMNIFSAFYPRNRNSFGNIEQTWNFGEPGNMNASYGEESPCTQAQLKI